jgi:gamma-glutamyltranspeptidase/glutathione hydrolase
LLKFRFNNLFKGYGDKRRELIDLDKSGTYQAGKVSHTGTVYMTVADKEGNMVSLIQSNYRGMGSGMVPPKLGFMLQDRGELFDLEEGKPNSLRQKNVLFIQLYLPL